MKYIKEIISKKANLIVINIGFKAHKFAQSGISR
jgi:hypothetical protein